MKTWKTIIVDDEPFARLELKRMLIEYPQIKIVGEADSVPSAKKIIQKKFTDLVLLDIDLGPQSGFDLLESLVSDFRVIFVTAYDEFAIRAFQVNALDYLLKPVHPKRLQEAISRLGNPYGKETKFELELHDKILINCLGCSRFITVSSIAFIKTMGDYTQINTIDGLSGVVHHTLKKWLTRLPENVFNQVHRSFLVNLNYVQELRKKNKDSFEISLKYSIQKIPVSRHFTQELKRRFEVK